MLSEQAALFAKSLQDKITDQLNEINKVEYTETLWMRPGGGGGCTRIYNNGAFLEKGGVNFSEVHGELDPSLAQSLPLGEGSRFYATGVSVVLHPQNPFLPTVHCNYRYIQRGDAGWFGGGSDLTPYYVFEEDVQHFHRTYANALKPFGKRLYSQFKEKCDKYFYLPHREETRGMGGIFFDYMSAPQFFEMWKECGDHFLESYLPIVKKRKDTDFEKKHRQFQLWRRGRYVEFNLLYDRGTLFGLKTKGRIESIFMSLPPKVIWQEDFPIEKNSLEEKSLRYIKQSQEWI